MSALVGTVFLASLAVVHSYKSFCLEIPCDATTYGSIQNVFVYDQVAIKNLDKVPHHIVCKFTNMIQPGGSFVLNSSVAGQFTFKNMANTLSGVITIDWHTPVGVKTLLVGDAGFVPARLEIFPGDTVTLMISNTTNLHGIRSYASNGLKEGDWFERVVGGTSNGATNILSDNKQVGEYPYFDPKAPDNKGVIVIKLPPDTRPAQPDNVGCSGARPCNLQGGGNDNGGIVTKAPGPPDASDGGVLLAPGQLSAVNSDDEECSTAKGCNNMKIFTSHSLIKCMNGCETPASPSQKLTCDGMKCFVKCAKVMPCDCPDFVYAKCLIAVNPRECDANCNAAAPRTLSLLSTAAAAAATLLLAVAWPL